MILAPPSGGVNGARAPTPHIPPAGPSLRDITRITSAAECQAHLARHADGSVLLLPKQVNLLNLRIGELAGAAIEAARPVHVQPSAAPAKKAAKKGPSSPTPTRPATTGRVYPAEKVAGYNAYFDAAPRLKLDPVAGLVWCYLWTVSVDGRATTTTKVIGLAIGRSRSTASRAVAALEAAGLVVTRHHGEADARSLADALSHYTVRPPAEPEPDTTTTTA